MRVPINGGVVPSRGVDDQHQRSNSSTRFPWPSTDLRRFEDIAFDQYGYFYQGVNLGTAGTTGSTSALLWDDTRSAAGDEPTRLEGGEGTAGAAEAESATASGPGLPDTAS